MRLNLDARIVRSIRSLVISLQPRCKLQEARRNHRPHHSPSGIMDMGPTVGLGPDQRRNLRQTARQINLQT